MRAQEGFFVAISVLMISLLLSIGGYSWANSSVPFKVEENGFRLAEEFNGTMGPSFASHSVIPWYNIEVLQVDEFEIFLNYVNFDNLSDSEAEAFGIEIANLGNLGLSELFHHYLGRVEQNAATDVEMKGLHARADWLYDLAIIKRDKELFARLSSILPPLDEMVESTGTSALIQLARRYSRDSQLLQLLYDYSPEANWDAQDAKGNTAARAVVFSGGIKNLIKLMDMGLDLEACKPGKKAFSSEKIWELFMEEYNDFTLEGVTNNMGEFRREVIEGMKLGAGNDNQQDVNAPEESGSDQVNSTPYSRVSFYRTVIKLSLRHSDLFKGWCVSEFLHEFEPKMAELFDEALFSEKELPALTSSLDRSCAKATLLAMLQSYKRPVQEALLRGLELTYFLQPKQDCSMVQLGVRKGVIHVAFPNDARAQRQLRPIAERYLNQTDMDYKDLSDQNKQGSK